ncbi:MAG: VWA domain-containing protein [Burkholderiaceae bacterium]
MAHRILDNITHFVRILRRAGLPVGTDRALRAAQALEAVGFDRRADVRAALMATLLTRHEQQEIFDAAFEAFWRDPKLLERMMMMALPTIRGRGPEPEIPKRPRRVEEALQAGAPPRRKEPPRSDEAIRFDALLGHSDRERLRKADFEAMSADEYKAALRLAATIELPLSPVRVRRLSASSRGRVDLRRTLRRMSRDPDTVVPARSTHRRRPPPLVILIDISGSMERYARVFLHFAHGLTRRDPRIRTLVFGTRLTVLSRTLRHRDPDTAMQAAAELITDWSGGTRIATSLAEFNRKWARRLLTGNAAMLLVTDGLDRDEGGDLGRQAALLSRFAHELVWLNPLLRFDGFEPRASGVRALLPHVDRFLPVHNLDSLHALGHAFASAPGRSPDAVRKARRTSSRPPSPSARGRPEER